LTSNGLYSIISQTAELFNAISNSDYIADVTTLWLVSCMQLFWTFSMDHWKENVHQSCPYKWIKYSLLYGMNVPKHCHPIHMSVARFQFSSAVCSMLLFSNRHHMYVERWRKWVPEDIW
jgi:hypothetical protein